MVGTPETTSSIKHTAQIFARWCRKGVSGREEMEVEITMPLAQMIEINNLQDVGAFSGAVIDGSEGSIEMEMQCETKDGARSHVLLAARTLRFIAATGLRPASMTELASMESILRGVPGRR